MLKNQNNPSRKRTEFRICAELHTKNKNRISKRKKRYYVHVEQAFAASLKWIFLDGKVLDTLSIYHRVNGFEIGTIKISSMRKIEIFGLIKEIMEIT